MTIIRRMEQGGRGIVGSQMDGDLLLICGNY